MFRPEAKPQHLKPSQDVKLGTAPHTVTVYNRATIKVLIYLYYEYYPTVTEWALNYRCQQNPQRHKPDKPKHIIMSIAES